MIPLSINIPIITMVKGTNICHQHFTINEMIGFCLISFGVGWIVCLISVFKTLKSSD